MIQMCPKCFEKNRNLGGRSIYWPKKIKKLSAQDVFEMKSKGYRIDKIACQMGVTERRIRQILAQ